ncbi:MAG: reverse transcriptase domain-containing protein [Polyangiaceae bacterium]|jgi:hypothetical protein
MTASPITLADVASESLVERILNPRRTKAWSHGTLRNPAADGSDTYEFFTGPLAVLNRCKVADAIANMAPWSPLVEDLVPKPTRLKVIVAALKSGLEAPPREHRSVHHDTRIDHARQLALRHLIRPLVEKTLTRVAVAYVQGRRMDEVFTRAVMTIRGNNLGFTKTLDVKGCFDHVDWLILDRAIDRHLGTTVDGDVRALLKSSYRAPALRRDGTEVTRTMGVPQGSVLAPLLINLYFADFDRIVQRTIANFGCTLWRYSDDLLVAAPSVDALQKATQVIRRELRRLRMAIKPETDHVCDLGNPENPARWLGLAFTHNRTWVPRDRIERKAAELLGGLVDGRIDASQLDEHLLALGVHYDQLIHPDEAAKAVRAIRTLIEPYLACGSRKKKEEEGIERIRKQIERRSPFRRSKPAPEGDRGNEITLAVEAKIHNEWTEESPRWGRSHLPSKGKADDRREVAGEARPGVEGTPYGGSLTSRNGNMNACNQEMNEKLVAQSCRLPLVAPTVSDAPPLLDRAAHREGVSDKFTLGNETTAVVRVTASQFEWGTVSVEMGNGSAWSSPFRMKRAASAEEIVLAGYRLAIPRALARGALRIALVVDQPTIDGYLFRGYRIRSVFVMHQWVRLLDVIDALPNTEIGCVGRDGQWVASG